MTEEWALLFKAIPSADPAAGCEVIFLGSVVLELDWGLAVLLAVPELIPQGRVVQKKTNEFPEALVLSVAVS